MTDIIGLANHVGVFIASAKIWLCVYGSLLLTWNILFTFIPTTVLGITLVYSLLVYFRVPSPPPELITEVFGEDANILIEKFRRKQIGDLSFIPTTSRLALANMSPVSSKNGLLQSTKEQPQQPYTMWTSKTRVLYNMISSLIIMLKRLLSFH